MRVLVSLLLVAMFACGEAADSCSVVPQVDKDFKKIDADFKSMTGLCAVKMREQVSMELKAALTYMAMGAHFSLDSVNRPGFAKMFFESASEEREHAFKIIEYLLMRGLGDEHMEKYIKSNLKPVAVTWASPLAALKAALGLEISVTESITRMVKVCEDARRACNSLEDSADADTKKACEEEKDLTNNDFHLVDYLTGEFLEEQLHGQRDLAGKIATLGKMVDTQGVLAEFLFDKKLLNGEPL